MCLFEEGPAPVPLLHCFLVVYQCRRLCGLCCVKHYLLSVYIVLLLTLSRLSAGRIWCRQNNLVSLPLAICCTVQSGNVCCICSCRGNPSDKRAHSCFCYLQDGCAVR